MFCENTEWDAPSDIQALNEAVFHADNKTVKNVRAKKKTVDMHLKSVDIKNPRKRLYNVSDKNGRKDVTVIATKQHVDNELLPTTNKRKLNLSITCRDAGEEDFEAPVKKIKRKQSDIGVVETQLKTVKDKHSDSREPVYKRVKTERIVSNVNRRSIDVSRLKLYLNNSKQDSITSTADTNSCLNNVKKDKFNKSTVDTPSHLNDVMSSRLNAARFRYINQQLYSCSGQEAGDMFRCDQESFVVYHNGFQSQVDKWPTNPVDKMIDYIRHCDQSLVVADFGCGDAKIAHSVPNIVHSFDFIALNDHVTPCNMTQVPLKSSSIDIAVFCLSLMGNNLVQYLCEAHRVLKPRAVLLIAEVRSRFDKIGKFIKQLRKLGFVLINEDMDNKMFVWFELQKSGSLPAADKLPNFELSECVYKKR